MIDRHKKSRGFTVVELIVAMSISAVTLLSGYELLQALKTAGDRQTADLAAAAGIIRGMDIIRENLLHAVSRTDSQEPVFVGANPDLANMGEEALILEFYSRCPVGGDGEFRCLRRMFQIRYTLAKTEAGIRLHRSITPVVGPSQASDAENQELILDRIEQITLSFHDGENLVPQFSSKKQLPLGVTITMTAYGRTWPLSVRLPCGDSQEGS